MNEQLVSFLVSIATNVVWVALVVLSKSLLKARWPIYRLYVVAVSMILLVVFSILYFGGEIVWQLLTLSIFFAVTTVILAMHAYKLWSAGIESADLSMNKGVTAEKSLHLVTHRLDFLGVGASKLTTNAQAFEDAVRRCHQAGNGGVRILLCNPRSPSLRKFAALAEKPEETYVQKVVASLEVLRTLRKVKGFQIEVRFYPQYVDPPFRMFCADDRICLVSPYVFGDGDGSELPQVFVGRRSHPRTFYKGFSEYFSNLWKSSAVWNFTIEESWKS